MYFCKIMFLNTHFDVIFNAVDTNRYKHEHVYTHYVVHLSRVNTFQFGYPLSHVYMIEMKHQV